MKTCKGNHKFGIGAVLVLAGLTILAGNLGMLPANVHDILLSWPMILIAISLINLVKGDYTVALIFAAIGGYFILPRINPDWPMHDLWKFWPVFLIAIGLSFIFRKRRHHPFQEKVETSKEGMIDEIAIFGGRVSKIESPDFKGGRVTSIFGGVELHLEMAQITGNGAVLDVSAIFGGVKIVVPRDWNVKVEVTSVFGGFADKRMFATEQINSKTLIIKGATVFGGGELANS